MQHHDTNSSELPTSTDNSLELSSFKIDLLWINKLGPFRAILYCFIISLSDEKGLSFKNDEYFADRLKWGLTTVKRALKHLEEDGFISRTNAVTEEGRIRTISIRPIKEEK